MSMVSLPRPQKIRLPQILIVRLTDTDEDLFPRGRVEPPLDWQGGLGGLNVVPGKFQPTLNQGPRNLRMGAQNDARADPVFPR